MKPSGKPALQLCETSLWHPSRSTHMSRRIFKLLLISISSSILAVCNMWHILPPPMAATNAIRSNQWMHNGSNEPKITLYSIICPSISSHPIPIQACPYNISSLLLSKIMKWSGKSRLLYTFCGEWANMANTEWCSLMMRAASRSLGNALCAFVLHTIDTNQR